MSDGIKLKYWTMEKPVERVAETYRLCIETIADNSSKARFQSYTAKVLSSETGFIDSANRSQLHLIEKAVLPIEQLYCEDMTWLYDVRLVGGPARPIYNRIRAGADYCPLCGGDGLVFTLDHHLPKKRYPGLAVTPLNLVPSCYDCNFTKKTKAPNLLTEQTLHPYFDNVDNQVWLSAWLDESSPPALSFYVDASNIEKEELVSKISQHFDEYELNSRFTRKAPRFLAELIPLLRRHHNDGKVDGVREELRAIERGKGLNSWQAAACRALCASDWYCNGGFSF